MKLQEMFSQPADEQNRLAIIEELLKHYPALSCRSIGKSLCGREIPALTLGNPKEMVLFCGAFHGMEWITSLLLLKFLWQLCDTSLRQGYLSDVKVGDFLERRGLLTVPCVNPDGVEISLHGSVAAAGYEELVYNAGRGDTVHWQANARGVDINHNFDANWCDLHRREQAAGIVSPAPTRFGGAHPESEPETRAMTNLCRKQNIRHALAFHSQGEEIYWNFGDCTPPRSELMAKVMAVSSGYCVSQPEGLAQGGGFKDWFLCEYNRPAFTIEVGKGENPLPLSDFPLIYDTLLEMLTLSTIM